MSAGTLRRPRAAKAAPSSLPAPRCAQATAALGSRGGAREAARGAAVRVAMDVSDSENAGLRKDQLTDLFFPILFPHVDVPCLPKPIARSVLAAP